MVLSVPSTLPGVLRPLWGSLHRVWNFGGTASRPVRGPDQALHRSHQDRPLFDFPDLRGLRSGETVRNKDCPPRMEGYYGRQESRGQQVQWWLAKSK